MMKFQEKQSLLRVAMQTLVYPAVLGSIIYSVFGNFEQFGVIKNHLALVIMMLSIVIFYCVDFLTTYLKSNYSILGIFSDVLIIGLMYAAFESINFIQYPMIRLDLFCACMAATFLVFVIVDCFHRHAYKNYFIKIIIFEVFLVLSFGTLAVVTFSGEEWWIAGLSTVTSATMVTIFSKMYQVHYSGVAPEAAISARGVVTELPSASVPALSLTSTAGT
jgi:hypothetical protein